MADTSGDSALPSSSSRVSITVLSIKPVNFGRIFALASVEIDTMRAYQNTSVPEVDGVHAPTAPRHRQEDAFPSRTALPARQCPGELAHRLLMLLVPDFSKVAGDLELHTLVHCDLPPIFFPDTFVKIGDRRAQRAGDIK